MRKVLILAAIVALLLPNVAVAAGSCTATTVTRQNVSTITYVCTGDASTGSYPTKVSDAAVRGWVVLVDTVPGSTQPTTLYDITLSNGDGIDVMAGKLADRSATLAERAYPSGAAWVDGTLTLAITNNSVASARVTVKALIYREP